MQSALCQAVRNALQALFEIEAAQCDVMYDGQPKPACGETFWAVWPGEWNAASGDYDLDEYYGVRVTLTRRAGFAPKDSQGTAIWMAAATGMEALLRKAIGAIHKSYSVMNAANTLIATAEQTTVDKIEGFDEPLQFLDGGRPAPVGPEWFSASDVGGGKFANAGITQTLTFGRARRLQAMPNLE